MYNVQDLKVIVDGVTDNHLALEYRDDLHIITEDRGKPTVTMIITLLYVHTAMYGCQEKQSVTKINYTIFNNKFKNG